MVTDFSGETGGRLMENWEFSLLTSDRAWNKLDFARQRNVLKGPFNILLRAYGPEDADTYVPPPIKVSP